MPVAKRVRSLLGWALLAATGAALVQALGRSPREAVMGDTIRILYVHAGAAWVAYLAYGVTAVAAVVYLLRRSPFWDRLAASSAEVGVMLTTVTLVSGMIWGKAAQGWWWQWSDRRLTLTLFLWFLYIAYLALRRSTAGGRRAAASAVIAVAGVPAMLINHFATLLFRGYHPQPIIARPDAPAADSPFLFALALSLAAYSLLYAWLLMHRVELEERRDAAAERLAAEPA